MTKFIVVVLVTCSLWLSVSAQAAQEPQTLDFGKPIEREIAGGQSHTYKIHLTAGQFVRFRLEQRAIDAALTLSAPDGKPLVAMNLTGAGEPESLSIEAATGGSYRLTVQSAEVSTRHGSYRLEVAVQAQATVEHRKRLAAETLLVEVGDLTKQRDKTAPQVIEKMQQALSLWRELGEPQWTAYSLYQIGIAYSDLNQFAKAIEHYEPALVIARDLKFRLREANTLSALGFAYNRMSHYEKAIENYEQALAIYRELKNQEWEGKTLRAVSGSFTSMGRFEKALQYREQALVIVREARDRLGESQVLIGLGALSYRLGRTEKAIEYYEQALRIAREIKDREVEDTALGNLAGAYNRLGRTEKAIEYFEQALAISRAIKDREGEAWVLSNLGVVYSVQGRYEKTVEYHEQALAIFRDLKSREREANTLINLGGSYSNLGRSEKAIEYYEQALAIYRERKIRDGGGSALLSLGEEYSGLSRSEKAIEYFEQALAIFREVKNRPGEAKALNNLGSAHESLGHHEKAIAYHEQALGIAREVKNRINEGDVLNNLGNAFRSLRRVDESVRHHEQALAIAREIKGQTREAAALNSLMLDWKAGNQVPLAIYFGKQSVNTYQEIRSNLRSIDAESQRSFLKSKEQTYRQLADLLISEGRLPEAEQVIRMLKEEEYFEFIRRDENSSPKAARAALTPEEQAIEKRYREIADRVAELGSERGTLIDKKTRTPEEEQRLAKIDADLVVAGTVFQKFLDGLATLTNRNAETGAKVFAMRESQGLMEDLRELGKGVVALYTLVGEDKYRVILTTADFQKGYEYPIKSAELNRKVLEFREVLQNPKYDPLPLAQELYKILVGPVAKDLQGAKAQVLMWSLDGVLRYLPIAALHDGKQYLVEQYRNTVFTPASQSRLLSEPGRKWTALGLGVSKAQSERIPALPGVVEEMHGIIREAGSNTGVLPGTIKLDEAFTQEVMLTELRKRNPVVHIASHFQFSPGNETNSALLLGDGKFLSLAQIKSLPNVFGGVELLTLSACNTATGGSGANGKEVEGFGVLAQRQGAKAVIASLWPVFDTSTKVLMQDFYRLREARIDTTKVEALRQAQLRLLRGEATTEGAKAMSATADRKLVHEAETAGAAHKLPFKPDLKKPYAHPYYWAPFILIGNWR